MLELGYFELPDDERSADRAVALLVLPLVNARRAEQMAAVQDSRIDQNLENEKSLIFRLLKRECVSTSATGICDYNQNFELVVLKSEKEIKLFIVKKGPN